MWRVNVRGQVTETVARLLDKLQVDVASLSEAVRKLQRQPGGSPDVASLRKELQAGGSNPLNVEGLLGHLSQPQTGGALALAAFPATNDPVTQEGALFVLTGSPNTLYRVNRSQEPPSFDPIGGSGSVTSVSGSGGTTGLTLTGGPITGAGTLTLGGTLAVANGGTGDTGSAWTAYTPTVTAGTGSFTTVSATGRYKTIGKTTFISVRVTITTNGTAATYVQITLPNTAANISRYQIIVGRETASTSKALTGAAQSNTGNMLITFYDGTYPGADGFTLDLTGVYEST